MAKKAHKWEAFSLSVWIVAMVCVMTATARLSGLWWAALMVLLVALGVINVSYLRLFKGTVEAEGEAGRLG